MDFLSLTPYASEPWSENTRGSSALECGKENVSVGRKMCLWRLEQRGCGDSLQGFPKHCHGKAEILQVPPSLAAGADTDPAHHSLFTSAAREHLVKKKCRTNYR